MDGLVGPVEEFGRERFPDARVVGAGGARGGSDARDGVVDPAGRVRPWGRAGEVVIKVVEMGEVIEVEGEEGRELRYEPGEGDV